MSRHIEMHHEARYCWVEVVEHGMRSAFALLPSKELLETVEFLPNGSPDWSWAGCCDLIRGSDPDLQLDVAVMLS